MPAPLPAREPTAPSQELKTPLSASSSCDPTPASASVPVYEYTTHKPRSKALLDSEPVLQLLTPAPLPESRIEPEPVSTFLRKTTKIFAPSDMPLAAVHAKVCEPVEGESRFQIVVFP
jgi:hypothetical protein